MISAKFYVPQSLRGFLGSLKASGRRNLFSAAAAAVSDLVRRHIASEAPRRHFSADRLSAQRTGHLEKAARKTVFHADEDHGEVVIPSPGFGRAFHDVTIAPKGAGALTLPLHSVAYGRRVKEVRALGWMIFRPKGTDVLMGYEKNMMKKDGQHTPIPLYALKKRVQQRQDRSLLPDDRQINFTAARAMMAEIYRASRKAAA